MKFNSKRLNYLIDKYGSLVKRNDNPITLFIDEDSHIDSIHTILVFCKESDKIDIGDTFLINGDTFSIKKFVHHTGNHYELLLSKISYPLQLHPITLYKSTISFNNCSATSKDDILFTTKIYSIKSLKATNKNSKIVLDKAINILVSLPYNSDITIGTVIQYKSIKMEVMIIENINLDNTSLKLHCKEITNINLI